MTPILPITTQFVEGIRFLKGDLILLVVSTAFASFLIPATVLLFFFTPLRIWRSPLFIFNTLSVALGLTMQVLYMYVIINAAYHARNLPPRLVTTIVAMSFLVPISVQGVLLVRLIAVYPPSRNTRKQNIAIYVPVVAFKIVRLINAAFATEDLVDHLPTGSSLRIIAAAQFVWGTRYVKIEWFLPLFDDMFVSGLFVHKLYASLKMRKEVDIDTGPSASDSRYPILFNIAQLVVVFCDPNFFQGATVVTVNCYITIIGVLLATIWGQGSARRKLARFGSRRPTTTMGASLEFAPRDAMSNADSEEIEEGEDGSAPRMRL